MKQPPHWQFRWTAALAVGLVVCPGTHSSLAQSPTEPSWQSWGSAKGFDRAVFALTTWDPDGSGLLSEHLVAGGWFSAAGGAMVNHIARWDGHFWQPFGGGRKGSVDAVTTWDRDGAGPLPEQLVAAGGDVASWDGTVWQPFGSGEHGYKYALTTWDPDGPGPAPARAVVGGDFFGSTVTGAPMTNIAGWDGAEWETFGGGTSQHVFALTSWDPDGAGPLPARVVASVGGVAAWDGAAWHPLGSISGGAVRALTTWDPDGPGPLTEQVVVGGSFRANGADVTNYVARWDGTAWQPLGAGLNNSVLALTTWDPDGPGPLSARLVAGGYFTTAGGVTVNRIAQWDGAEWRPFGTGVNAAVFALTTWDPDGPGPLPTQVVAGGSFTTAGGLAAPYLATWSTQSPLPLCPADFDSSGQLSIGDVLDFLAAYFAPNPRADFNGVGGVSVQDILDFLAAYLAGCP